MRIGELKALLNTIQRDTRPKLPQGNHVVTVESITDATTKDGRPGYRVVVVDGKGRTAFKIMSADNSVEYLLRAVQGADDEEIVGKTVLAAVKSKGYVHAFLRARRVKERDFPSSQDLERRVQAQMAAEPDETWEDVLDEVRNRGKG